MGILDRARQRLTASHPALRFTHTSDSIEVPASVPGGFDVWITADLIVGYDGWHEHFESEEEALACFAFGLTGQCRLKVTLRGEFACKWTMETFKDGAWIAHGTTGLLLLPFWRWPRIEYRQNVTTRAG
jgi:hypothetical protein